MRYPFSIPHVALMTLLLVVKTRAFMFPARSTFVTQKMERQSPDYPSRTRKQSGYRRSVGRGDRNLHRTVGMGGSGSLLSSVSFDSEDLLNVLEPAQSSEEGWGYLQERVSRMQKRVDCEDTMQECYCILFNPNSDSEGIHTIEVPPNSGRNFLLAFEAKEDCVRFSLVLRAQGFFEPVAEKVNFDDVKSFCSTGEVNYLVVPKGTRLSPPVVNKDSVDFLPEEAPGCKRNGKKELNLSSSDLESLKISLERSFLMSEE
mmetsp:Transcript_4469/g.9013  ORF Transcript_4469/g.9013 Transcript_4469/m.9013 type:complete len:259 (-) Transcript_4469:113-889(-)